MLFLSRITIEFPSINWLFFNGAVTFRVCTPIKIPTAEVPQIETKDAAMDFKNDLLFIIFALKIINVVLMVVLSVCSVIRLFFTLWCGEYPFHTYANN